MNVILPVVLCGGSGTRLWPLSRREFPKQFAVAQCGANLLELALERAKLLADAGDILCAAGEPHRHMVAEAMEHTKVRGQVVLEPEPRNTAPAICCAALVAHSKNPDSIVVVMPSDHYMPDAEAFIRVVSEATRVASEGWWVTFGVKPTDPSAAYGYIIPGEVIGAERAASQAKRFIEKPDSNAAIQLIEQGAFWNSGIFLARSDVVVAAVERHLPATHAACSRAVENMSVDGSFLRLEKNAFAACESISIDHAVLEKHDRIAVVPYEHSWSDLGSWKAISELYEADGSGNRAEGDTKLLSCHDTFIHSPCRLTVALGLHDVTIIDTPDALLVASHDYVDRVGMAVAELRAAGRREIVDHRRVTRPWGVFEGIDRGDRFQVKRISVKPGAALSLQYHYHRAEHWIVVRGTARVTRGEKSFLLFENESTFIPSGTIHRLENPGKEPLELIEVQSGSYLGEDDIVRLEDRYGRPAESNDLPSSEPHDDNVPIERK